MAALGAEPIYLTDEELAEDRKLTWDFLDARRRGDWEEVDRLVRKMQFPACCLMAGKKLFGADFIRKRGYDTTLADKAYGPGWLDREEED